MIFTLRSNQARVERAEKAGYAKGTAAAEERAKAAVAAAVEAANASAQEKLAAELAALQQAWESWNERRLAAARDSRPFAEPPPGTASGINGNGGISGSGSA